MGRRNGQSRLGKRHGPNETRRRREIAGQPQHPAPLSKTGEFDARNIDRRHVVHGEVDVVAQVREVPIEGRRVGDHAQWIIVDFQFAAHVFQHDAPPAGIVDNEMARWHEAHVLLDYFTDTNVSRSLERLP